MKGPIYTKVSNTDAAGFSVAIDMSKIVCDCLHPAAYGDTVVFSQGKRAKDPSWVNMSSRPLPMESWPVLMRKMCVKVSWSLIPVVYAFINFSPMKYLVESLPKFAERTRLPGRNFPCPARSSPPRQPKLHLSLRARRLFGDY